MFGPLNLSILGEDIRLRELAMKGGGDGAREDELGRSQSIHLYPF